MQLFANNAVGVLASALTTASTSLVLQAGQGARFPALAGGDTFTVTLFQIVNGNEANYEIVKVTALSVDTMTIVRAQEGTTARAYGVGDQVSMRATAGVMANFAQKGSPVVFTQTVAVPNVTAGDNTTNAANTAFVTGAVSTAIANLVNSSPAALDTLKELADAIGDDPNYAATMAAALGNRLRTDVSTQGLNSTQQSNARTNLGLAAVAASGSYADLTGKPVLAAVATSGAKADVGLGNVDNTSDANKPVSSATQTALNAKAPLTSPGFTGNVGVTQPSGTQTTLQINSGTQYGQMFFRDTDKNLGFFVSDGTTSQTRMRFIGPAGNVQLLENGTGNVLVGTTADDGVGKLQVTGNVSLTGTLLAKGQSLLNGATTAYAGNSSAVTINYNGIGSQFGVALKPASATADTNALTFLSSASTYAASTVVGAIQHLANDVGMNLTGTWKYQGSAILTPASKDASGGYAGLTGYNIDLKNAAGTVLSQLASSATAARTYTFPDKDVTVASTTNETFVNPTIKGYVEQFQALNPGATVTLNPGNGTLIELTVTAATTITLPAAVAGVCYTLIAVYNGAYGLTFTGGTSLRWAGGSAPTATSTAGKIDKYIFTCGSTYTLAQDSGRKF